MTSGARKKPGALARSWAHCKSAASLSWITLNLLVWCGPLALLSLLKWLLPRSASAFDRWMDEIYRIAVRIDDFWLRGVLGIEWNRPAIDVCEDDILLVVSNHVSWADVLLIQSVVAVEGPILKFLAKRELSRIPIFGLIFWAFDFPLLDRRGKGKLDPDRRARDLEALRLACDSVRRRPAALINFVEGTRFAEEKRARSGTPLEHLLPPRAGGFVALVEALGRDLDSILDLTLIYPPETSFWKFLSGEGGPVRIEARTVPREELGSNGEAWRQWLGRTWREKDDALREARARRLD